MRRRAKSSNVFELCNGRAEEGISSLSEQTLHDLKLDEANRYSFPPAEAMTERELATVGGQMKLQALELVKHVTVFPQTLVLKGRFKLHRRIQLAIKAERVELRNIDHQAA